MTCGLSKGGVVLLALLLTGCASTVTFPRGPLALMYADLKAAHARARALIEVACKSQQLTETTCARLAEQEKELAHADRALRKAILAADSEPDWQAIFEYASGLAKLAL